MTYRYCQGEPDIQVNDHLLQTLLSGHTQWSVIQEKSVSKVSSFSL